MTLRSDEPLLPATADFKFLVYTLACREFLKRLGDIKLAVEGNQHLDCIAHFDNAISLFFQDGFKDATEGLEQFQLRMQAETNQLRRSNSLLGRIFNQLMEAIYSGIALWTYQSDINDLHILGRDLARSFFAESPWHETQKRLSLSCHLDIEFDLSQPPRPLIAYRPGHHHADCTEECSGGIVIRFSFKHNFDTYLAYPFLFLHEYTAHVYAVDNQRNPRFNDGWMIHAAARFIERQLLYIPSKITGLYLDHTDIFYAVGMVKSLDRNAQNAHNIAARYDTLVSGLYPNAFRHFTYELAAFEQHGDEDVTWPSKLINTINVCLRSPDGLIKLVNMTGRAQNARELMLMLSSTT